MREFLNILTKTPLFDGIMEHDLETMLGCLGSDVKKTGRGEALLLAGDTPEYIGVVLSGQIHIIREDYSGNRLIVAAVTSAGLFAEALCCAGITESPVSVIAGTDAAVMLLRFSRILNTCSNSCSFHTKLIANMLKLVAGKNLLLQNRIEIISLKSVREKVTRYLAARSPKPGLEFTIPFNREELADYLCVERSALSHELARMKREGLIEYNKNRFTVYVMT